MFGKTLVHELHISYLPTVQLRVHKKNPVRYDRNVDAIVNMHVPLN